jgi:transcriptional regulator with XRE-family HTH domain
MYQMGYEVNEELLQVSDLARLVRAHRNENRLSLRAAAKDSGVSFNTLARVEKGHVPDLETFTRLAEWIGVSPARFFGDAKVRPASTPDEIEVHLLTDPALSEDAAKEIAGIVRQFYRRLAEPEATAFHLRAATTFKPEAARLLGEILVELRQSLEAKQ